MAYLHGVEITEIKEGSYPITVVNSSVVGLVGIAEGVDTIDGTAAPDSAGKLIGISSLAQAEKIFGKDKGGFTILAALKTIFDNGGAYCIVVNVLKRSEAKQLVGTTGTVNKDSVGNWITGVYPKKAVTGTSTLKDYSADIIKGIQLLKNAESELGYKAKVIIAPGYAHQANVMAEGVATASSLKAVFLADVAAATPSAAITTVGTYNFNPRKRALLCYPSVLRYNTNEGELQEAALSQFVAAAIVARDQSEGYWVSPSNYPVVGISQSTLPITSSINDPTADTSLLNEAGIVTLFRAFGTGYRIWGNWTAAGNSTNKTIHEMIAPIRVRDVVEESIQQASLDFIDRPINNAVIDSIKASVNAFLRSLIGRGAIVDGSCLFKKEKNTAEDIAQGKLAFTIEFVPAPSLDRLVFESFVNLSLLNKLTA